MMTSVKTIICISSLIFLSGCFGECMYGGFEYTRYGSDFYVYQTSGSLSNYENKDVLNYTSLDYKPEIESQIKNTRISIDGTVHFYFDRIPQIIDYGLSDDDVDSLNLLRQFPHKYLFDRDIDIYPSRRTTVHSDLQSDSLFDPYKDDIFYPNSDIKSSILSWRPEYDSNFDTLLSDKTNFYAENKFRSNFFYSPRFQKNGDIYFISKRKDVLITSDSSETNFYLNPFFVEAYLVKYNSDDGNLDSLATVRSTGLNSDYEIFVRKNSIAVYTMGAISFFHFDGTELDQIKLDHPEFKISFDGKTASYKNESNLIQILGAGSINLDNMISDIDNVYPSLNEAIVISNDYQLISVVDLNQQIIIEQIDVNSVEGIPFSKSKRSDYKFQLPLFDTNGNIKFMILDSHYFDDPNEPCD